MKDFDDLAYFAIHSNWQNPAGSGMAFLFGQQAKERKQNKLKIHEHQKFTHKKTSKLYN